MNSRLTRAFTLVELLLVVLILAIMASLVVPTIANASAPINDQVSALLEADMKRGKLSAMGTLTPTVLVVGAERDRWWLQSAGKVSEESAIESSMRVLGRGNLSSFAGHRLEVTLAGDEAPNGDVVVATFDLEGGRDAVEVGFQLVGPNADEPLARWNVRPERTRVMQR
ncbi:MAG: hypothetical protein RLY21_574 [Planctomycetota bacterium]|jgi:prepilin-type N-terminal cleavage/methylation domain-containing protein